MDIFEIFPWNSNFETGIGVIDEQHREIVSLLNSLGNHIANRSMPVVLNNIYDKLATYADYHFQAEEKVWRQCFPEDDVWFLNHESSHNMFISRISELRNSDSSVDEAITEVLTFLTHWLASHILESDKRMAVVVLEMESGLALEQAKDATEKKMSGSTKLLIDTVLSMYGSLSTRTIELMREKALRKKAEEALLASEEKWNFLLEHGVENVWDWNIETGETVMQETDMPVIKIFQDEDDDHLKIHPSDKDQLRIDLQNHLDGKTGFFVNKYRVLKKSGSWVWSMARGKVVSRDGEGRPLRMVGTNTDITERELAIMIYQYSSQAMFVTDANNQITSINPAFTKITGYSEQDILGRNPAFFSSGKHDRDFYKDMWARIKEEGVWSGEIINRKKDGSLYSESLYINTIKDSSGRIDFYIALFYDITEYKQTEMFLRQAQKMEAIGHLTGGISHDFNNILCIISLNMGMLKLDKMVREEGRMRLDEINNAVRRAVNLNQQLLVFARQKPYRKEITDLNRLINDISHLIRTSVTPGIKIQYKLSENLGLTELDPGDFENAVLNLVINARDAIRDSGNIVITTENCSGENVIGPNRHEVVCGEYIHLSVSDNGSGIKAEEIEHLFEPFYTTKEEGKGTGLGLATVYSFIRRSEGIVRVVSDGSSGSVFHLYFPAKKVLNEPVFSEEITHPSAPVKGKGLILVVDDELALVNTLKEFLESVGYSVLTASGGQEALDCLKDNGNIDLLFTDVVMPGMNGYELTEKALELKKSLRILMTSGYTKDLPVAATQKRYLGELLKKPYSLEELAERIQKKLSL